MKVPNEAFNNLIYNIKHLDNPKESKEILRRWDEDRKKYKNKNKKVKDLKMNANININLKNAKECKALAHTFGEILTDDRISDKVKREHYNNYLNKLS